jgi:NCAIR mutase (PurE)-related protein
MDMSRLRGLLDGVQGGQITVDEALERLRSLPYEDLGHARLDLHRELRQGMPEVVYCENKTTGQAISILSRLWHHHERVLATRVSEDMARQIQAELTEAQYDPTSRLLRLVRGELPGHAPDAPYGLILSAGTADLPVAEEAAGTLEFLGSRTERRYDVGVAGLHRLLDQWEQLQAADVIVTVAGMEGALTSVVAGLVGCPVVGVPTSVGYGASFAGLAPLLTMLNACAPGVAVVNIDNGFGAGVYAHLILRRLSTGRDS